ncbi:MAG: hypothetical protein IM572_06320 [Chitinophagaceae bacterium]|nr:hypothetical protein [Microcystis sp. M065S1]MCA6492273.1 hypothetical protein [Chitinophagaceae bacterium]
MSNEIICPKCGGNQFHTDKKGFSGKKAVAGAVLTGGVGLLAGTIGSNKVVITCLNCGHQFKPGDIKKAAEKKLAEERFKNAPLGVKLFVYGAIIALVFLIIRACS